MQANEELFSMGLRPMTWPEVLQAVQDRLDPAGRERFARLHRNFVAYLSAETLDRFYGFVFSQGLHLEINGYRFHRLAVLLERILARVEPGAGILDIGAGAGLVASVLARRAAPRTLVVQDPCREVRAHLSAMGFRVLPHPPPAAPPQGPFDLLLCVDSLGEINADDDGTLAHPERVDGAELPRLVEERYGFAHKLEPWKPYLARGGRVLLWEPIARREAWEAIAAGLAGAGWKTALRSDDPDASYLELTLE
jgi:hypothetical protein